MGQETTQIREIIPLDQAPSLSTGPLETIIGHPLALSVKASNPDAVRRFEDGLMNAIEGSYGVVHLNTGLVGDFIPRIRETLPSLTGKPIVFLSPGVDAYSLTVLVGNSGDFPDDQFGKHGSSFMGAGGINGTQALSGTALRPLLSGRDTSHFVENDASVHIGSKRTLIPAIRKAAQEEHGQMMRGKLREILEQSMVGDVLDIKRYAELATALGFGKVLYGDTSPDPDLSYYEKWEEIPDAVTQLLSLAVRNSLIPGFSSNGPMEIAGKVQSTIENYATHFLNLAAGENGGMESVPPLFRHFIQDRLDNVDPSWKRDFRDGRANQNVKQFLDWVVAEMSILNAAGVEGTISMLMIGIAHFAAEGKGADWVRKQMRGDVDADLVWKAMGKAVERMCTPGMMLPKVAIRDGYIKSHVYDKETGSYVIDERKATMIPKGSIVVYSPYLMSQHPSVLAHHGIADVLGERSLTTLAQIYLDHFRNPDDQELKEIVAALQRSDRTFGAGQRVCTGGALASRIIEESLRSISELDGLVYDGDPEKVVLTPGSFMRRPKNTVAVVR